MQERFIGLAQNNAGFQELNQFLSKHLHNKSSIPERAPTFENACIIYPYKLIENADIQMLRENEYIGIRYQDLSRLRFSPWAKQTHKHVLLQPVTFNSKVDFNVHRLLRAIDNNALLSKLPKSEQLAESEYMLAPDKLKELFKEAPHIIKNTEALLEQCDLSFDFSAQRKSQNLSTYTGSGPSDRTLLYDLCEKGIQYRYNGKPSKEVKARIKKELGLIEKMNFISFFLINWDIISYAQRKGYFHVGRGSGANSIIAYLLGITDVDPIELDLYFERFMNLYRATPPDFDIDFSTRDRPDVTRHIFDRFGSKGQAALLATYNTFKHSAAVRELGKVFGLPKHEIDALSNGKFIESRLEQIPKLVLRYAKKMEGMPNYLSVHAAGIIISQKPIHYFSATEIPPKGFPITQFDMHTAEDVGLYKFDILGQRGLGKIKDTLSIIKQNKPLVPKIDIHDVKPIMADPNVNEMVSRADCIGCFYVESPGMRMLLQKLKVNTYLGLVAASSIIRPGVSQSGMMREYIKRHKDPERLKDAHPVMLELMPETYGVMVYQEDVIKVAHYFAGLDLGEADVLRRGMSGKYRSREEFQQVKDKFIANCKDKGYSDTLIQEVWMQTESFAGYAFAKGHSASYAVESYQSLYLKHYYPLEYLVAVLNNGGGFYRSELYLHEVRMKGGRVYAPCINKSFWGAVIYGNDIYIGLGRIHNMEHELIQRIEADRMGRGEFESLDNFLDRIQISFEQIDKLIRIGAFRFSGQNKRKLLWEAMLKLQYQPPPQGQYLLFKEPSRKYKLPTLSVTELETAFDQIELLGYPLIDPFLLAKGNFEYGAQVTEMKNYIGKRFDISGYLITIKNTRTVRGEYMHFGTFIDRAGHWIDTVHFPPIARQYPFNGKGVYKLSGIIKEEFGYLTLEVDWMVKVPYVGDPRYVVSRR